MKTVLLLVLVALFSQGCTSVKPGLWQPLPSAIVVANEFTMKGNDVTRKITIPAGTYRYWKTDDYGYLYVADGAKFTQVESILGIKRSETFDGAFMLSNRMEKVLAARVETSTDSIKEKGELPKFFLDKAIAEKGYYVAPASGVLSREECEVQGIKIVP